MNIVPVIHCLYHWPHIVITNMHIDLVCYEFIFQMPLMLSNQLTRLTLVAQLVVQQIS